MIRWRLIFTLLVVSFFQTALAQKSAEEAYQKLISLTKCFHGNQPFQCKAIVEVKYVKDAKPSADTSKLVYRDGYTWYKSKVVENIQDQTGTLLINHELKTIVFQLSDSLKQAAMKEIKFKPNKELESKLDSSLSNNDLTVFHNYLVNDYDFKWEKKGQFDEILFTPKKNNTNSLRSLLIRFDEKGIHYYEYSNRDVYANDWKGNPRFRLIKTYYTDFNFQQVPPITAKVNDYLLWKGWRLSLKKNTNYQFSIL